MIHDDSGLAHGYYWVWYEGNWIQGKWDGEDWELGNGTICHFSNVVTGPKWNVPEAPTLTPNFYPKATTLLPPLPVTIAPTSFQPKIESRPLLDFIGTWIVKNKQIVILCGRMKEFINPTSQKKYNNVYIGWSTSLMGVWNKEGDLIYPEVNGIEGWGIMNKVKEKPN